VHEIEKEFIGKGYKFLIGIDEAGRGPLAGPVVAGAVGVKSDFFLELARDFKTKIDDSKKLTSNSRLKAYHEIIGKLKVGIGLCNPNIIDKINILEATKLAMARSISYLISKIDDINKSNACALIDGRVQIDTSFPYYNIPRGDARSFLISCASIVAKVVRDEIMLAYDFIYPNYKFCRHKGYGTKQHLLAIKEYGITSIHRKSFSPCRLKITDHE